MKIKKKMLIYQTATGSLAVTVDSKTETIWLSLNEIAELFDTDKSGISRHLRNIFTTGELDRDWVVAKNATTGSDGKTYQVEYYNLDAILSIGYRVNSKKATQFRKWATETLRHHLVDGYTVNKSRIAENYTAFLQAVEDVKKLLPKGGQVDAGSVLELITAFADTWFSLDAYDREELTMTGVTQKEVTLTATELTKALHEFRDALIKKGEATELFGRERDKGSIGGIVGNVMQSFDGGDVYATLEEKAAHLLYFIVKNHLFTDGNKRSGAYAFVWFLNRVGILNREKITPPALTALTLLIAESDPKHKDRMVGLVLQVLRK